ncbi:MAG: hypothetical protein AVDCRST_MAG88-2425, partial [uncultured Thermomicrobiales bacterium]
AHVLAEIAIVDEADGARPVLARVGPQREGLEWRQRVEHAIIERRADPLALVGRVDGEADEEAARVIHAGALAVLADSDDPPVPLRDPARELALGIAVLVVEALLLDRERIIGVNGIVHRAEGGVIVGGEGTYLQLHRTIFSCAIASSAPCLGRA